MSSSVFHDILSSSQCEYGFKIKSDDDGDDTDHGDDADARAKSFFKHIWQHQPMIFRSTHKTCQADGILRQTMTMGFNGVADMLHNCRKSSSPQSDYTSTNSAATAPPLFFQNGSAITDPYSMYSSNPYAAYLDGCSIVVNHADLQSASIAKLCNDLQSSFPHVYANAYLTPPNGFAVNAHADDRDVFVIQVLGMKKWKVYRKVPVEYPFENEQVGKSGREVPPSVFEGGLCFGNNVLDLGPGDVMYMPRGFVHEATTEILDVEDGHSPSFHITIAIATHDWCLSVVLADCFRKTLSEVVDYRKALPIGPSKEYEPEDSSSFLKRQLNQAMKLVQSSVTADMLDQHLRAKYKMHNTLANEYRSRIIISHQSKKRKASEDGVVGYKAASALTLESVIRVSTPEERNSVVMEEGQHRGLTVRDETRDILLQTLGAIKGDPSLRVKVGDLRGLIGDAEIERDNDLSMICDFTQLSFARCCVELGALAVVEEH